MSRSGGSLDGGRGFGIAIRRLLVAGMVGAGLGIGEAVSAQDYRSAVGWAVGGTYVTSLNDGADAAVALEPEIAPFASIYAEHWFGGGLTGVQVQLSASRPQIDWQQGTRNVFAYSGQASLVLRLGAPRPGRSVIPYIGAGVGGNWWRLGDGPPTAFSDAGALYDGDEGIDLIAVGSLGFDIVTSGRWGDGPLVVRVEASDAVQFTSPFDPVADGADEFGLIHNARLSIGIHTGIGRIFD